MHTKKCFCKGLFSVYYYLYGKIFLDHFISLLFLPKDVFVLQDDFLFVTLSPSYWLLHYRELCIQSCQLWSCSNAVTDVLWLAENWSSSQTNQHKKGHSKCYQEHHNVKYDEWIISFISHYDDIIKFSLLKIIQIIAVRTVFSHNCVCGYMKTKMHVIVFMKIRLLMLWCCAFYRSHVTCNKLSLL